MTFAWRRTACRMRHCCARRIVVTGGRRKLGCTSTRWAERQRIIEAEANRIATATRLRRAQEVAIGKHCSSSSCSLAMKKRLSLGVPKGVFSFAKENTPFGTPRERRFFIASEQLEELQCLPIATSCARRSRVAVAIRFASASIIRCRSAHLVEVQPNFRLPPVTTMRRAQQCRIRQAVRRQANVTRASR